MPPLPSRLRLLAAVASALLLVGAGWFAVRHLRRGSLHAVDAIPADAFLAITIDIDALRASPLGGPLLGGASSKLAGERTLTTTCGFDPLTRMTEIAIAVPEKGEPGEFGIAIRAAISRDELIGCARRVIESRRAAGQGQPVVRESGSYTLVEPDTQADASTARLPTLAYRDGGPFLIARGDWLSSMIDTVEGRLPSLRTNDDHMSLRTAVGSDKGAAVVATALLPKGLRERLRAEMAGEAGAPDPKAAIMAGVLGVSSAGIGISAGHAGADSDVVAAVRCEEAPDCAEVEKLVARKRLDLSQDFGFRLMGMGAVLDSMKIENLGRSLRITAHARTDEAARWLERVLTVGGLHHPMPAASSPARPPPTTPPTPDEILKPSRDAGPNPP